ncbi:YbbR-like domain-containing protein [uncultured Tenacibaculum sp.]|uniref:CdaR family protein n=1 Tax=uncultured Tenacibaculum sp. TaxID=174713 RepID=UPI00262DF6FC|nr:YbbR-like domain-containing protein [uncultured Tenacibaculum sp.]
MKIFSNIPKVFFGFLFAAALMWLLINLSKEYSSVVKYEVNYINLPQNKVYKSNPIKHLDIIVEGSGFKLFAENLSTPQINLDLETLQKKGRSHYFFLPKNIQSQIQKQLRKGIKILAIEKDSIIVSLDKLASKKVPLKPNVKLNFQLGYDLAKPIEVTPSTIAISGTQSQLNEIKELVLEELTLSNVSGNVSKALKIISPKQSSIKFEEKEALINLEVDKFTEGEVDVPITIKNIPSHIQLNIFPKKVKVTYKVGLSNFNKISSESFVIICDYQKALNDNVNFLIPQIKDKPTMISSVRLSPNKIDFLINK